MSIVKSDTKIALYDNINNKPLYTYSIIIDSARYIKDGKYLLKGVNTLAILNVNGIDGAYVSDPYNQLEKGKVTNEGEGWLSIKKDIYTLSSFDNKYIYLIDSTSYVLQVLDRSTLEAIHNIKLDYKPVCLESHNGYIAIGFGSKEFMRIYNTDDWSFENIQTASKIDSLIVYNDKVIYAESGQHCYVYQYNITSKETIKFGVTSYGFKTYSSVKMSINKDDGILYIGEGASYSSSTLDFYDFNANEYIYQSPFSTYGYVTVPVKCLGKYIKYGGAIVDGRTGVFVSSNGKTRLYNYNLNLIGVKTIYDDNNISVFTASNDGECYTYVYDVINSKIISSINGYFDTAVMVDSSSILLFANGSNIVKNFTFEKR